jgi:hypothetical protein
LLELRSTLQLRWRALTPVLATPIAKSSWLPATRQDLRGRQLTSTSKTSPQTSCLLRLPRTRPTPAGTLDVSATEDGTNGASVSGTAYPSATSLRPSNKSRAEYTPPLSNASCRSQQSHTKLRGYALEKSSPSSLKTPTSCGSTTGSTSLFPPGTATTKPQVVAQTSAATVLEPSYWLSPTVLVQTPADPHRVATAIGRSSLTAALAEAAVTPAAVAATAEAPTTGPTRGPTAEAVAAVETTRTATPPEPHRGRLRRPPED